MLRVNPCVNIGWQQHMKIPYIGMEHSLHG